MAAKAKAPARARPVAKKAVKPAKPLARKAAKTSSRSGASKPIAKPAPKSAARTPAKTSPAAKSPVAARPEKAPASVKAAQLATAAKPAAVALPPAGLPTPKPSPPARPTQPVSPQDLVAAHEYLLSRSASRSEAAVTVNGRQLLTEEQLLAMSDADYMNEDQLAFFKYRLQQMERELLSNADETTEHLRETVIVPDPADRATIEEEHALELRTRDRERKLLKKVQASLRGIESGDYGYCEETGDPIGIPRLLARPTATLSLEAQQRREIKQKLFGD
ncbi:MAG TPA: RNA polymerase-binding protein DksA [Vicinamibacterales bacterium]